ncbi:alpha/beta-hydrolase [Phlegmacium glaucopus]|nr:alpha/beta-hydrolase [Phlegmacium glaucopus]
MSPLTAPYGTWTSPVTAEAITKGAIGIADVIVDRVTSEVYHIESRPSEAGRNVLVHTASGQDVVGAGWNVRTAAQEYGGAAAIVHNKIAYYSNLSDGGVYQVNDGGQPERVTPVGKPYRYACLEPHPKKPHLLVSILEDHTHSDPSDVVTTLVVINTVTKSLHPLVSGADFYALPRFSPDGNHITWQQWHHPDMPWEGGEVYIADVIIDDDTLSLKDQIHVAGVRGKVSACYPSWRNNDNLIFTSDESGYVNPWKYTNGKASPLFPEPIAEDFGAPFWSLGNSFYALIDKEGKFALFSAIKNGRDVLYLVDLGGGSQPKLIENPFVVIDSVRTVSLEREQVVFRGQKTDETPAILRCSLSSLIKEEFVVLKPASEAPLPRDIISQPQPITLKVPPNDSPLHVIYYPPYNPKYSGSSIKGERPPCIVSIHGGPTGLTKQGLNWGTQYYTSRGWGWLDVNYGGSSGYGRKYIERLASNWGIVDVQDSITAAQTLGSPAYDLIDNKRLVIRGGSAGGFTVLAALSIASDVKAFAAATSLYGVSDLRKLYEFTHKFESKYLAKLVGGTPEEVSEVYKARSPIYHADNIVSPLLILQGEIDAVVPKSQAESIYNSIKKRGGVVEYKLYPGEGHGWRKEENMRDACERELAFYQRALKLT